MKFSPLGCIFEIQRVHFLRLKEFGYESKKKAFCRKFEDFALIGFDISEKSLNSKVYLWNSKGSANMAFGFEIYIKNREGTSKENFRRWLEISSGGAAHRQLESHKLFKVENFMLREKKQNKDFALKIANWKCKEILNFVLAFKDSFLY